MKKEEIKKAPKKTKNGEKVKYVEKKVRTMATAPVEDIEVTEDKIVFTIDGKYGEELAKGLGDKSGVDSARPLTTDEIRKILKEAAQRNTEKAQKQDGKDAQEEDVYVGTMGTRIEIEEVVTTTRGANRRKPAKNTPKEDKDKIKKRIIALGLLVPLLLPLGLCRSCARENPEPEKPTIGETQPPPSEEPTLVTETKEFDIQLYDVPNPYVEAWEMVRSRRARKSSSTISGKPSFKWKIQ